MPENQTTPINSNTGQLIGRSIEFFALIAFASILQAAIGCSTSTEIISLENGSLTVGQSPKGWKYNLNTRHLMSKVEAENYLIPQEIELANMEQVRTEPFKLDRSCSCVQLRDLEAIDNTRFRLGRIPVVIELKPPKYISSGHEVVNISFESGRVDQIDWYYQILPEMSVVPSQLTLQDGIDFYTLKVTANQQTVNDVAKRRPQIVDEKKFFSSVRISESSDVLRLSPNFFQRSWTLELTPQKALERRYGGQSPVTIRLVSEIEPELVTMRASAPEPAQTCLIIHGFKALAHPELVDFGTVDASTAPKKRFRVGGPGDPPFKIHSINLSNDRFIVSQDNDDLNHESHWFTITLKDGTAGQADTQCTIWTSNNEQMPIQINIKALIE